MQRKHILGLSLTIAALASVAAYAQKNILLSDDAIRGVSADLPVTAKQRVLSQRASRVSTQAITKAAPITAKLAPPIYPVTEDEVYDVDSFGRNVKWLGLASAFINVQSGCPKPTTPDEYCQELNTTPGAYTSFTFNDAARVKLPKGASNSILCYWFSPVLTYTYSNPTTSRVIGRFRYNPTLTIENPVLSDPSLIDPTTGAPFGGQLLTSMTSSERLEESLEPGVTLNQRTRDSTICMAGFISHRALIQNYGLTPAQADDFFANPTTVRLNVTGSTQFVSNASMVFGLRIVGD
jgi:hypothetical protein